jgi:glycosyltransferase involved in cell wall biosynthesis
MFRLAYFVSHPIQYQAPLLQLIAADPDISLQVFFYSDFSLRAYRDTGFNQLVEWDVPLTEGYDYHFLDCWGSKQYEGVMRQPVAKGILPLLRNQQFDAVWVHGWSWLCSLQVIWAANHLGIPVLIRGESNELKESTHPLKKYAKKHILNRLFQKIDRFLYIGQLNRSFYENHGVTSEQLFPMPYAVNNHYFQQKVRVAHSDRDHLRQTLNLTPGRSIILYAAKLIEVKRPLDLLNAYRLLSVDGVQEPDPYLLFVGDGVLRSQLEIEAQKTGWTSIRFLGFQNQSVLPALYDLCDVFVLPSGVEPWGLAINEVMNAGKPVVITDQVGCGLDLVREGQNGRTFPVGNISALADAMRWAIKNTREAGAHSLNRIQTWSFAEDLAGLKASLQSLNGSNLNR